EFMLLANKTVAEHVFKIAPDEKKPNPFIFRVHDKPDQEKLHKFREFMQALGYKVQIKANITPADFQAILKQIEGGTDEILIKEVALRTMMKAVYSPVNAG
ncbi:MAG: RNB domain-containing ribonuclease, partial [Calditrichaeota bacterium]|nr:RNB domain-containing ribonuclease [Calditrichota bacterium]